MLVRLPFNKKNLTINEQSKTIIKQLQRNSESVSLNDLPLNTDTILKKIGKLFPKVISEPKIALVPHDLLFKIHPGMVAAYEYLTDVIYIAKELIALTQDPNYSHRDQLKFELEGFLLHELIHMHQAKYGIVPLGLPQVFAMEIESWINQIFYMGKGNEQNVWHKLAEGLIKSYGKYYEEFHGVTVPNKNEFLKAIYAYLSLIS